MAYKVKRKTMAGYIPLSDKLERQLDKKSKSPYKIVTQDSTESGHLEVWQLPHSQYAIQYLENEKGDNRWRVVEVYVKDGEVRTRGDLPYKDYDSYEKALDHIEYDFKIEQSNDKILKSKKKSYYWSLKPEKMEKAHNFLNANYTTDELNSMDDKQSEKILKANRKEWDY